MSSWCANPLSCIKIIKRIERIIEPSSEVENIQNRIRDEVVSLLHDSRVELIGSMAVPMAGRPEIDVMVISRNIEADSRVLAGNGYIQGPIVHDVSS